MRSERWGVELAGLRALPVRLAVMATPPVAVASFIAAQITGTPDLLWWAGASALVLVVAVVQLASGRPHPPLLMVVGLTTMAVVNQFSSVESVPGVLTGMFTIGLVVTVVFERSKMAILYVIWITLATASTLWSEHPGWGALVGLLVLAGALTTSWILLDLSARELWRADQRHREMFESASDALIAFEGSNTTVMVNRRARRVFGYENGEAVGRPVGDFIPAFRSQRPFVGVHAAAGETTPVRTAGVHERGHEFPVEVKVTSTDDGGDLLHLAMIRDLTDQVEAEERADERLRIYQELFNGVPIGLYRSAPDGRILDANPALADILGAESQQALLGTSARDYFADPEDRLAQAAAIEKSTGPVDTEIRFRRLDGTSIWVRDRTKAVRNGEGRVLHYEGAIQDITDERDARDQLQSEIRSKTELVAAVSHELRTPLTAVLGFIEMLRTQPDDADDRSEYLRLASEQANELSLLVEDLLTAIRIEHDDIAVNPELIELEDAVTRAADALGSKGSSEIQFCFTDELTAWCDPSRLRQIVRNLIDNAITHGAAPVWVSAEALPNGFVTITVTDHGDGIEGEAADRIFDAFYRGYEAKTRPGSIGLGLAVSRHLALLMHGDLEYRRTDGATHFVLTLPASPLPDESDPGQDRAA
jgi:PAS domain S-box-containing protein